MEAGNVVEEKPLVIPPIHQSIASTDPKDYLTVTQRFMILQNLTSNPHYSYRKSKQVQSPYNLFNFPSQDRTEINLIFRK